MKRTQSNEKQKLHPDDVMRNLDLAKIHLTKANPFWPTVVTIHPTDLCNHYCQWCYFERSDNIIELDNAIRTLEVLIEHGVHEIIVSGGGEPLLHPRSDELFKYLTTHKNIHKRLYTNGSFLEQHPNIGKAFDYIRVSMDAGTSSTYARLHGTLERWYFDILQVLGDYGRLHSDLSVGVSMVITQQNQSTWLNLVSDCEKYGIGYVFLKPNVAETAQYPMPHFSGPLGTRVHMRDSLRVARRMIQIPPFLVSMNMLLNADNHIYPCCHLNSPSHRISDLDLASLQSRLGSPEHVQLLVKYIMNPHPCRIHDLSAKIDPVLLGGIH